MIVIKIEMWPGGDSKKAWTMAHGTITNIGGDSKRGSYSVWLSQVDRSGNSPSKITTTWKTTSVLGFKRTAFSVWYLLCVALTSALGSRVLESFDGSQSRKHAPTVHSPITSK